MYKFYKQEVEDLQPKHTAVTHIMSIGVITEMKKYETSCIEDLQVY